MKHKTWDEISIAERIERWENVIRVLQALSPHEKRKHFNMTLWGWKEDCGTVACAGGHCSFDPWFRKRGFSGKFDRCGNLEWQSLDPFDFFGVEGTRSIFLCEAIGDYEPSVAVVVRHIKAYIKALKAQEAEVQEAENV